MKCYELPAACEANLFNKNIRPYVRIAFEGNFFSDKDIIECVIQSYRSVDGGTRNLGDLILIQRKQGNFLTTMTQAMMFRSGIATETIQPAS